MLSILSPTRTRATFAATAVATQARSVSSSPYGRTHVWKHRQRKLPNPVVPQFPQLVIRADGSSFTQWTTSPRSFMKLTRDTTNAPLWNVSALANEGMQEESETTGRLGRFSRRFETEVDMDALQMEAEANAPVGESKGRQDKKA